MLFLSSFTATCASWTFDTGVKPCRRTWHGLETHATGLTPPGSVATRAAYTAARDRNRSAVRSSEAGPTWRTASRYRAFHDWRPRPGDRRDVRRAPQTRRAAARLAFRRSMP